MSRQYWSEGLTWATSDGTAVANTTTETIVFPNVIIPANYMQDGRTLRLRAFGKLSTTGTPTSTFTIRWGGVSGTILAVTEAITNANNAANVIWSLEAFITTRTNGSSGTLFVTGEVMVNTTTTANVSQNFGVSGFDAPAAVTVDLTADTALSLTTTWSAASSSNTLTGNQYYIESIN